MSVPRPLLVMLVAVGVLLAAGDAAAISPQNPYRSFNLSGLNYGSMQWERARRQGRPTWPSNATTVGGAGRVGTVTGGGFGGGAFIQGGSPRPVRGWLRRR